MSKIRKILFISNQFHPPPVIGGSAAVYDEVCRRGASDIVALGGRHSPAGRRWTDLDKTDSIRGYIIHRVPWLLPPSAASRKNCLARLTERLTRDIAIMAYTVLFIAILIVRYRVQVVCLGELVSGGWLVFPIRYIFRRRVMFYAHGEEIAQEDDWMLVRLRGTFLRHANAIFAVSRFCKGEIVSRFGINPERVWLVSNGVDLATFRAGQCDRSRLSQEIRNRRIVLAVGRLYRRKGHEELLRALPAVLARVPDAHCVIVGDGPLSKHLRDVAADVGVVDQCTFLRNLGLPDLVNLYRCCEVFVLPCQTLADGDTEGFGLVFLEANACGAPVVAGAAGGTVEAVDDGRTGLLIDGRDPQAIASAVTRVLSDRCLRETLKSNGPQWAAKHSWDLAADTVVGVCLGIKSTPNTLAYRTPTYAIQESGAVQHGKAPALLVTVYVQEESKPGLRHESYSVTGCPALRGFHESCLHLGVRPIYLLSWPVMKDPDYVRLFKRILAQGEGELGIQLRTWVTPPSWELANVYTSYQCNLPEHVERRKLMTLCDAFAEAFGSAPAIHRAGRGGGSDRTSDLLAQMGIKIDLSPVAGRKDPSGIGPDCSNIDCRPFWSGTDRAVLTIPASFGAEVRAPVQSPDAPDDRTRWSMRFGVTRDERLSARIHFRAENTSPEALCACAHEFHRKALPVVVFSLHSTSLYPGGNDYFTDERSSSNTGNRALQAIGQCIEEGLFVPSCAGTVYSELALNRRDAAAVRCA
jgi:glycosyltransferase involved in cell wall biosynthesis